MPLPYLNRRENQLRLNGRMPVLYWPRFRPSAADTMTFTWWCISVSAYAVIVTLGMDAFRFMPSCCKRRSKSAALGGLPMVGRKV